MTKGTEIVNAHIQAAEFGGWKKLAERIDKELNSAQPHVAADARPKIVVLDISGPGTTLGWMEEVLNAEYARGYRLIATTGEENHLLILENQKTP